MGISPVPNTVPVTQYFGAYPAAHQPYGHTGMDFGCNEGTKLVAVADGKVVWADWGTNLPGDDSLAGWASRWYLQKTYCGICVVVEHDDVWILYSHLSATDLNVGDVVREGDVIGLSGNTGFSTGPHLHFEAIPRIPNWNNNFYGRVNPAPYITGKYYVRTDAETTKPTPGVVTPVPKAYTFDTKWTTKNQVARSFYGNYGPKPTGITIHHWGATGQKFDNVAYFLATNNAPTSAHYVVEDGRIACLASPEVATFHAGHAVGNGTTVGIEMRPEATAGDVDTLVQLIFELEQTYGSMNIYKHSDWFATACPGKYGAMIPTIINRVNAMHKNGGVDPNLSSNNVAKKPTPAPTPKPATTTHTVVKGDTLYSLAKKYNTTVEKIKSLNTSLKNTNVINIGQKIRVK